MKRFGLVLTIAAAGLLVSCQAVCACLYEPPGEIVYGRVESATGSGIPTAVVLYRLALDTVCVFGDLASRGGEIDVGAEGRFRAVVYSDLGRLQCLELSAFDPASGEADTTSILIFVDFAHPDSTGVVLRLP